MLTFSKMPMLILPRYLPIETHVGHFLRFIVRASIFQQFGVPKPPKTRPRASKKRYLDTPLAPFWGIQEPGTLFSRKVLFYLDETTTFSSNGPRAPPPPILGPCGGWGPKLTKIAPQNRPERVSKSFCCTVFSIAPSLSRFSFPVFFVASYVATGY